MKHPVHQVAIIFARATARTLTPAELARAIVLLEGLDPDELEHAGDGVPSDLMAIVKQELASR